MVASKKKIDIREYERALLTDTLPYEIPIFYSNANLAVLAYRIRKKRASHPLHEKFLLSTTGREWSTVPYTYEIARGGQPARRLAVMHPISQHLMSKFYGNFDQFICNTCNRSPISLRFPSRVATHYIDPRYATTSGMNDGTHSDEDPVGFRDQQRWASTYFSYRDYSLSHKFFESEEFIEHERRYKLLLTLDVSRCFDSIYTHSIEWSMRGKGFSKNHLPKKDRPTFESSFDETIRHGNWNETHGILVGPESSRIFAEVVLQSADRAVINELSQQGFSGRVRRYVDDYYVFSNSADELVLAEAAVRKSLQALNLHLNDQKRDVLKRPFVSTISVVRHDAAALIDHFFNEIASKETLLPGDIDPRTIERARSTVIASLRRRSVELKAPYDNFSSFALSVLKQKLRSVLILFEDENFSPPVTYLAVLSWLIALVRIAQFLFSMDRRAATSYKLASVYSSVMSLASKLGCARAPIERQILDGLRDPSMGCSDGVVDEVTRINHLCCVDLLLTGDRRIEAVDIHNYLGDTSDHSVICTMSPFRLLAALFVSRLRARCSEIRESVLLEIERRLKEPTFSPQTDTSHAVLLTEFLACPHAPLARRIAVYAVFHKQLLGSVVNTHKAHKMLLRSEWVSFIDWDRSIDLAAMLERKELTPAYE